VKASEAKSGDSEVIKLQFCLKNQSDETFNGGKEIEAMKRLMLDCFNAFSSQL
jgi:hypothetical protein